MTEIDTNESRKRKRKEWLKKYEVKDISILEKILKIVKGSEEDVLHLEFWSNRIELITVILGNTIDVYCEISEPYICDDKKFKSTIENHTLLFSMKSLSQRISKFVTAVKGRKGITTLGISDIELALKCVSQETKKEIAAVTISSDNDDTFKEFIQKKKDLEQGGPKLNYGLEFKYSLEAQQKYWIQAFLECEKESQLIIQVNEGEFSFCLKGLNYTQRQFLKIDDNSTIHDAVLKLFLNQPKAKMIQSLLKRIACIQKKDNTNTKKNQKKKTDNEVKEENEQQEEELEEEPTEDLIKFQISEEDVPFSFNYSQQGLLIKFFAAADTEQETDS